MSRGVGFIQMIRGPSNCASRHVSPPLDVVAPDDTAEDMYIANFVCGADRDFGNLAQIDCDVIAIRTFLKFGLGVAEAHEEKVGIRVGVLGGKVDGHPSKLLEFPPNARNSMVAKIRIGHLLRASGASRRSGTPWAGCEGAAATGITTCAKRSEHLIGQFRSNVHGVANVAAMGAFVREEFLVVFHEINKQQFFIIVK